MSLKKGRYYSRFVPCFHLLKAPIGRQALWQPALPVEQPD